MGTHLPARGAKSKAVYKLRLCGNKLDLRYILLLAAAVILAVSIFRLPGRPGPKAGESLAYGLIQQFKTTKGSTDAQNASIRLKIIKKIIHASGESALFMDVKNVSLEIRLQNVAQKSNDALFILSGEGKSLVALYVDSGKDYRYYGKVDTFMHLKDVQIMPLPAERKGIVAVRERISSTDGSFEEGVFIRAYIWQDNEFHPVLNIMENFRSYYNQLWDTKIKPEESHWILIRQKAIAKWSSAPSPVLQMAEQQTLAVSEKTQQVDLPPNDAFDVLQTRNISNTYYWSDKWKHFIMGEGKDANGQAIAILEDITLSPYALQPRYLEANNHYRVKYEDGSIRNVAKGSIEVVAPAP